MSSSLVGRFAPSPTGPLHAGSMVAALASWLDVRAMGGRWLVRIEDIDSPRCIYGADEIILGQLAICGLLPDATPVYQSSRHAAYLLALEQLQASGWTYPCGCTRREIEDALVLMGVLRERHEDRVYPGTCRHGLHGRTARAQRLLTAREGIDVDIRWADRRLGSQRQNVTRVVGDFILQRGDDQWTYQLAVVVDDAWQGITHVVRGEDLADNTARQIHLQRLLRLPTPEYLHAPLVLAADGEKLSKQNGAQPLDTSHPLSVLQDAARVLELPHIEALSAPEWLASATRAWAARWVA